jgi:hypothetical protein
VNGYKCNDIAELGVISANFHPGAIIIIVIVISTSTAALVVMVVVLMITSAPAAAIIIIINLDSLGGGRVWMSVYRSNMLAYELN